MLIRGSRLIEKLELHQAGAKMCLGQAGSARIVTQVAAVDDQRRLGANLIEAVKQSGIKRVVVLSSLGGGLPAGRQRTSTSFSAWLSSNAGRR